MEAWIFAGIAAVVVGWIMFTNHKLRRLSSDEHYLEIAREAARIKADALDKVIAPVTNEVSSPFDHRPLATSAGVTLLYTVRRSDDRFIHHYSVSVPGLQRDYLAGKMFTLFVARLLGAPLEALTLEVERSNVCHAEFHLSAAEHDRFAERLVSMVSPAEIASFRKEYMKISRHLRWRKL